MNNCTDTSSLQNAISTASRLEEDIYCVMLYDMQGNLLLDGNDNNDKVKSNPTNLSFDKAAFSGLTDGYAITQPHVNTIYENKYPWVVTIAKKNIQIFMPVRFLL